MTFYCSKCEQKKMDHEYHEDGTCDFCYEEPAHKGLPKVMQEVLETPSAISWLREAQRASNSMESALLGLVDFDPRFDIEADFEVPWYDAEIPRFIHPFDERVDYIDWFVLYIEWHDGTTYVALLTERGSVRNGVDEYLVHSRVGTEADAKWLAKTLRDKIIRASGVGSELSKIASQGLKEELTPSSLPEATPLQEMPPQRDATGNIKYKVQGMGVTYVDETLWLDVTVKNSATFQGIPVKLTSEQIQALPDSIKSGGIQYGSAPQ